MNVLVVDDEKDMETLFQQRFRKEIRDKQIDFFSANSGEDALYYLEKHNHKAVLILSDINMPGMSGLELLTHIRHDFHNPPPPPVVMMITAYGDEENHRQAMENGADDFLTKPLDFNLLKEKLKTFGE